MSGVFSFSQREKVSAEPTDEGLRTLIIESATPHPAPSEPPSPSGRGYPHRFNP